MRTPRAAVTFNSIPSHFHLIFRIDPHQKALKGWSEVPIIVNCGGEGFYYDIKWQFARYKQLAQRCNIGMSLANVCDVVVIGSNTNSLPSAGWPTININYI